MIGLAHLLEIAELSDRLGAFEVDCLALGARRVSEFTAEDWRAACALWSSGGCSRQRRLLSEALVFARKLPRPGLVSFLAAVATLRVATWNL